MLNYNNFIIENNSDDFKVVVIPNGKTVYDLQAQKYILEYIKYFSEKNKRNFNKKLKFFKNNFYDKNNYEFFAIFDYNNDIYLAKTIDDVYNLALDLDVENINIVKNKKIGNKLIYDYYTGYIFGDYMSSEDLYDDSGKLKESIKENVKEDIRKHFNS